MSSSDLEQPIDSQDDSAGEEAPPPISSSSDHDAEKSVMPVM